VDPEVDPDREQEDGHRDQHVGEGDTGVAGEPERPDHGHQQRDAAQHEVERVAVRVRQQPQDDGERRRHDDRERVEDHLRELVVDDAAPKTVTSPGERSAMSRASNWSDWASADAGNEWVTTPSAAEAVCDSGCSRPRAACRSRGPRRPRRPRRRSLPRWRARPRRARRRRSRRSRRVRPPRPSPGRTPRSPGGRHGLRAARPSPTSRAVRAGRARCRPAGSAAWSARRRRTRARTARSPGRARRPRRSPVNWSLPASDSRRAIPGAKSTVTSRQATTTCFGRSTTRSVISRKTRSTPDIYILPVAAEPVAGPPAEPRDRSAHPAALPDRRGADRKGAQQGDDSDR